jgi:hypothetical protein
MKCENGPFRRSVFLGRSHRILSILILSSELIILLNPRFGHTQDQDQEQEPAPIETAANHTEADPLLTKLSAALESVKNTNPSAVSQALNAGEATLGAAPADALTPIGDLAGDGVPEMLLKWACPDEEAGAEVAPAPDSAPLWCVYLLSWNGAGWKVSRLVFGVTDFTAKAINLGAPAGRALGLIIQNGAPAIPYPVVFQVKDHAAVVVWDGQADESSYKPLLQSQVTFRSSGKAPVELTVTGRADPGLLQVSPHGRRGFEMRTVYRWNGKTFLVDKKDFVPSPDYTIYRFISALHLHDYRAAYALVVPAKFLNTDSPTLDGFRQFIESNFSEFLQDEIFEAPEMPAGSPEAHVFVLSKSEVQNAYHPTFSQDGKFLLTGLTRTHQTVEDLGSITQFVESVHPFTRSRL